MTKKKYTSEMESGALTPDLRQAVADIKTAILQGQYEAVKGVNRIQLAVYFGIGKYVSQHSRKGTWGTGALETISSQLRRELPGLRGYSASALKNMRKFYENWMVLDANPSVVTDEMNIAQDSFAEEYKSTITNVEMGNGKSTIANVEFSHPSTIDIYHAIQIPDIKDFPIEDFFRLPFSHHVKIIEGCKGLQERYYFIHRAVEENIPSDSLPQFIKNNPYDSQQLLEVYGVEHFPGSAGGPPALSCTRAACAPAGRLQDQLPGPADGLPHHPRRELGNDDE